MRKPKEKLNNPKSRTHSVVIKLSPEELAAVELLEHRLELNRSGAIREAIHQLFEKTFPESK